MTKDTITPATDSRTQQICELEVGQSFALARRISTTDNPQVGSAVSECKKEMRNRLATNVSRANKRTGHNYTTETIEGLTRTGDILVTVVVTRLD